MRTISLIIIHCSATPDGKDYTIADIDRWHKARGWNGCGYHYVIHRDGSIHKGRPEAQKRSLRALLVELKRSYPRALIVGHNTFTPKACPCFDAAHEYADITSSQALLPSHQ